eukprot:1061641-Rhodomonas_salina.1
MRESGIRTRASGRGLARDSLRRVGEEEGDGTVEAKGGGRDAGGRTVAGRGKREEGGGREVRGGQRELGRSSCLLYTSDAADDM